MPERCCEAGPNSNWFNFNSSPPQLERPTKQMREAEERLKAIPQFCFPDAKDWLPVSEYNRYILWCSSASQCWCSASGATAGLPMPNYGSSSLSLGHFRLKQLYLIFFRFSIIFLPHSAQLTILCGWREKIRRFLSVLNPKMQTEVFKMNLKKNPAHYLFSHVPQNAYLMLHGTSTVFLCLYMNEYIWGEGKGRESQPSIFFFI